jgi:hypothetical protein
MRSEEQVQQTDNAFGCPSVSRLQKDCNSMVQHTQNGQSTSEIATQCLNDSH